MKDEFTSMPEEGVSLPVEASCASDISTVNVDPLAVPVAVSAIEGTKSAKDETSSEELALSENTTAYVAPAKEAYGAAV